MRCSAAAELPTCTYYIVHN